MAAAAIAALALVAAGCGSGADAGGAEDGGDRGTVVVFAAASLTDAMDDLAAAFESQSPEYRVEVNVAGSSSLRAQILAGAPADVFASANAEVMAELEVAGAVAGAPTRFATNRLAIAVPAGNPGGVTGLADFGRDELFLGLCDPAVPCGTLADAALAGAGIEPAPDTREPDVRALLTKIEAGELDAGLVYVTDLLVAGDAVEGIELPAGAATDAVYPIALLATAPEPAGGRAFVDFVLSPAGRRILDEHGFGAP